MSAPDLLNWKPPVHANASDTEIAAARRVEDRVGPDCRAVLEALRRYDPHSATELLGLLGWKDVYRVRRRLSDLRNHFLVEDTKRRAKTATGRAEIIWQAVAQ